MKFRAKDRITLRADRRGGPDYHEGRIVSADTNPAIPGYEVKWDGVRGTVEYRTRDIDDKYELKGKGKR